MNSIPRSDAPIEDGPRVLRLTANTAGRDFVIGDLHGCMDAIIDTMSAVRFNVGKDRLFVCGDLVDRGPDNEEVIKLLDEPWFFSVRGNHDQAALDWYHSTTSGGSLHSTACAEPWLKQLLANEPATARNLSQRLASLPLAISISTLNNPGASATGIVHADAPEGWCWDDLLLELESGNAQLIEHVLWARPSFSSTVRNRIAGVDQIFAGHTPLTKPKCVGNVCYIDGGGVFRITQDKQTQSRSHYACAWNLVRMNQPSNVLDCLPFEYGLLRVYGPR